MATKIPTITITEASEAATISPSPNILALNEVICSFLFSSLAIGVAIAFLLLFWITMETAFDDPTAFNVAACLSAGWILVEVVTTIGMRILEDRDKAKEAERAEDIEKWAAYLETGRLEVV